MLLLLPQWVGTKYRIKNHIVLDAWQVASVTQFVVSVAGMIDDSCWEILEKAMATHSSTLAWKIPWKEEPAGLLSMGSHRVGHNRSDLAAAAA